MRSLKVVITSIALTIALTGFSATIVKKFNPRAFAIVCKYFSLASFDKRAILGYDDTVTQTDFENVNNWTKDASNPPTQCPVGPFVCAVCYDNTANCYTLATAVHRGYIEIFLEDSLTQGKNIGANGCTLIFYRQTDSTNNH
jgi:hypothetical protein